MQPVPFVFGRVAVKADFTNRKLEIARLKDNFRMLVNTVIISPRRWGKTSLVYRASEEICKEEPGLKICHIDLFNVRDEAEFYVALAREVLEATSTKWEEMAQSAMKFLSRLIPRITFSPDQQSEISFGIGWEELKKNPDDLLDLAEAIAIEKKIRIVLCIDEFQNIAEFAQPLAFQKKLRAHWQKHTRVAYCLFGSKRHMFLDVFTHSSMPFYNFGQILYLDKISREDWITFIEDRFRETGKQIGTEEASMIASLAENHPYYVQQLAQQAWLRTAKRCSREIVMASHRSLTEQLSLLFTGLTESLSNSQLGLLKALLSGEKQLSSQASLKIYRLGTSGNVSRLKKTLVDRDILDLQGENLTFQDPVYTWWLKEYYFRLPAGTQGA
jgi:AAA+ ATPase superfamily predicted ATPase